MNLTHKRPTNLNDFYFGSTYYPEHWNSEDKKDDIARMKAAGFNCVRMAEFAWDLMEPQQSVYDFSVFDEAIKELGKNGIFTILCTPTATPPRRLTIKHPNMLRVDENGVSMQHGSRQHCCSSNPTFRELSQEITQAMASHFKDNPYVIGWQTDNELHCHFSECHCGSCQTAFQNFLKQKFNEDISTLNAAWGTAFWSQTYASFDEIITPRNQKPTYPNPAHRLDYFRFISATVTEFQKQQIDILRAANPDWFVSHNGCFAHIDFRGDFSKDLDFLGYDIYPMFDNDPDRRLLSQFYNLDRTRCYSGNFFIFEHQSGPGVQPPYFHENPAPDEIRRMSYISVSRGADSLLYFRWRTCRFGAEEYWCGIIDHDNKTRRRYEEVAQIGNELKKIAPELSGTSVYANCAVASGQVDTRDAHSTMGLGLPNMDHFAEKMHISMNKRGFSPACIHPADDLSDVKLYVIPHWEVFDPAWVKNITEFVENGGTLVIGARTATRDLNNNVVAETLPGVLRDLAGCEVEEYSRINNPEARPKQIICKETRVENELWSEILAPGTDCGVFATWQSDGHYNGRAAITRNNIGKGQVYYVGTYLTQPVINLLLDKLPEECKLTPLHPCASEAIQITIRENNSRKIWFFINRTNEEQTITDLPAGTNLLTGSENETTISLPPSGVAIIRQINN